MVTFSRHVLDVESPWEGALLQAEQAQVGDFVEGTITKYFDQRLVVRDDN